MGVVLGSERDEVTRSVYIIGGAGTGKSTFTRELLERLGCRMGSLYDLYALPNKKNVVTLRGHDLEPGGIYLGCMRDSFPGTDGLDRASSPVGAAWLRNGDLPDFIVAEGATLATRPFIAALHETTRLLLVHLTADDFIKELRFKQRGSEQADSFVTATATRSANLLADMGKLGVAALEVDTSEPREWSDALTLCLEHLRT